MLKNIEASSVTTNKPSYTKMTWTKENLHLNLKKQTNKRTRKNKGGI